MQDITVYLNRDKNWYTKKRPKLQIDILSCLILRGKLSKGQAETILKKRHGDIIESFDILEKKNLIIKKDRIVGRGRSQFKYGITLKGVEALINDNFTSPLNFWKIMYGFCHHYYNMKNDIRQIDRFFDLYYKKYLHFSNRNYLDLHDIFNNVFKIWLEDYPEISNEISPEQKILEVLAINPPMTKNELKEKTNLDIDNINKILYSHTKEFFTSTIQSEEPQVFDNTSRKKQNKYYSLFLRHNLIKIKNCEKKDTRYELSLFGIILVIKLIRYYNIKNKENYYFNQFPFVDYFNKIVKNYSEKVPLIFGKWEILKEILKNYAIYNFDLIIDANDIFKESQISLSLGGSKELYHGIKEIILQTRIQLGEFADNGDMCRSNYLFDSMSEPDKEIQNESYLSKNFPVIKNGKRLPMYYLLSTCFKITKNLNPLEFVNAPSLNKLFDPYNKDFNEIGSYEEMFVEEISAIYYFNLYNDSIVNYEFYSLCNFKTYKQIVDIVPKKCLSQILTADNEINNFYSKWKKDIITLYKNIFDDINNFFV